MAKSKSRRSKSRSKRHPLAYTSLAEKHKKCSMKKYKSHSICKRYLSRRGHVQRKSKGRMDLSKKSNLKRYCKSKKFRRSLKCKKLRK
jgi:hypothetical protein|uniref:Uncharacterized protein n=1 Tax=viral metagenome TaxID=1070528 RepID=A0A6C0HDG2_9ZZZZ